MGKNGALASSSGLIGIKGSEDFAAAFAVSRESLERLQIYHDLLVKWQKAHNLVSPGTLDQIWHRHFADSAQLFAHVGEAKTIFDLGSGGGFPGLVLAILLADCGDVSVHLVESRARKCGFLREAVRQTGLSRSDGCGISVDIHHGRIEEIADSAHAFKTDLIVARALAPLSSLLALAYPFFVQNSFVKDSRALFLKGRDFETEIEEASAAYAFRCEVYESRTDHEGRILEICQIERR